MIEITIKAENQETLDHYLTRLAANAVVGELQHTVAASVMEKTETIAGTADPVIEAPTIKPETSAALEALKEAKEALNGNLPQETPAAIFGESETTAPMTTAPAADVKLDAHGFPWDDRIHAGSKQTMASGPRKGCWKYKPGVDKDVLVPQVEAELKGPSPVAQSKPEPTPAGDTGAVTDFVGLLGLVQSKGVTIEQLNPILQTYGLQALPMVKEQPELIPLVAAAIEAL